MDYIINRMQMMDIARQREGGNIKKGDEERNKKLGRLRESARDFESLFINEMFKAMRKNSEIDGGLIEKDNATKMFEEMRDMEVAKLAARSDSGRGIGLGEAIFEQMSPLIAAQAAGDDGGNPAG